MHHGTIIGGENRSRVINDGDRQFCLWATSICADTANGEVPLGRKATECITSFICRTQNANPRRGKLATLDLFNLAVRIGLICGAALHLRWSSGSSIPRRHSVKVEPEL